MTGLDLSYQFYPFYVLVLVTAANLWASVVNHLNLRMNVALL